MKRCHICGATAGEFYKCPVCGEWVCDQCSIECDECHRNYCSNGDCGDLYVDEATYHFCFKCKLG